VTLLGEGAGPALSAGAVSTAGVDHWQTGREVIVLLAFGANEVFIHIFKYYYKNNLTI
jgi:hypothetical protein